MAKTLPRWCKDAQIAMIEKDLNVNELARESGYTREYVSSLINGRHYSPDANTKISGILGIVSSEDTLRIH